MSKNEAAIGQHIITDATTHMRKTQYAIKREQDNLLEKVTLAAEEKNKDANVDALMNDILTKIDSEINSAQQFSSVIKLNSDSGCRAHYGIRFNKLKESLEEAKKIVTDSNFPEVLKGRCPNGFDNSIDKSLPTLGGQQFWGTSKPTFLTTFLEVTYNTLSGHTSDSSNSAIFHTFNCPENFNREGVIRSLFIDDQNIQVTIPHSGYSFGGDRMNGKVFRPQDCTSFLEMSAQLTPNGASTADLYLAKRHILKQGLVVVDNSWLDSEGGSMVKLFDANQNTPKPGDLYVARKFSDAKTIESSLGCGGHAGIYLGADKEQKVTLAYNRDMPSIEGFGLEYRDHQENSSQIDQFFLTRNGTNFTAGSNDPYPYNNLGDLAGLVSYVDSNIQKETDCNEMTLSGEDI